MFQSNLSGHKNLIDFLDSSIVPTAPGVHEVYLLMPYHKVSQDVKPLIGQYMSWPLIGLIHNT